MTTPAQHNAALCKNCNSPLGNHIIPKNNCPHGFDYYHAERFFEPRTNPTEMITIEKDPIHWSAITLCECGNPGAKPKEKDGLQAFACPTCWSEMQPCEGSNWITAADLNMNYNNE